MADKFVFSNFAVTTLRTAIGPADTSIQINVDDVPRFPVLVAGSKFPLVLADSDDIVEIVYVTALSIGGVATVERAQEGTQAQSWLAGTLLQHTFTAATVRQAAGLNPRGEWDAGDAYDPNDMVTHEGISYIATTENLNSEPSEINDDWMSIYSPSNAGSVALTWQGRWNGVTTYSIGQVVEYQNRIWQARAANLNSAPAFGNVNWSHLARWSGTTEVNALLTFLGTNNYTVTLGEDEGPSSLFNGLRIVGRFQNSNTGAATLTITRGTTEFAAVPLRMSTGAGLTSGDIVAGLVYEWTYDAGTGEFLATQVPGNQQIPAGAIMDFAGGTVPAGWLLCYGQAVSRTTYSRLFTLFGTFYGAGDGSTTFNIPDLRGRVTAGVDAMGGAAANVLAGLDHGETVGSATHTLTAGEMPVHGHAVSDPTHNHTLSDPTHSHIVSDPTHGHITNNPAHSHGVTDPTHNHALTDPGHSHNYADVQPNYSSIFAAGATQASNNSGDVARTSVASTTGLTLAAAATGISIQNATTNISVNNAATGVSVANNSTGITLAASGTGISVQNSGGGVAHNNVQPTMGMNKIIKI